MNFSLNSLKISEKLRLSVLSFSIPILMLLYFTVSGINHHIDFARLETYGNQLLQPLTELLVLVPQHQRLVLAAKTDDGAFVSQPPTANTTIEEYLKNLEKETQAVGKLLKITPEGLREAGMAELQPANIANQWNALQNSQTSLSPQEFDRQYNDLIQKIRSLISRVGDTSNLILDPDLDSYYLMDVTLLALPQAQQRVGEILLFAQSLMGKAQLTNQEKIKLEVYALSLQQADLDRIVQGITTSLREDKNFYNVLPSLQRNIPPTLDSYKAAVAKFNEDLLQIARSDNLERLNSNFFSEGDQLLRHGSQLWTVTRKELDQLLQIRIQHYEKQRLIYLVLSLTAMAFSGFLVFKISQEITQRLSKAVSVTKDVALGNLTARLVVDARDEIGQLLSSIKYMIENLNSLIKEAQGSGIRVSSSATQLLATAKEQELVIGKQAELMTNAMTSAREISQLIEKLLQQMADVASMSEETAQFATNGQLDIIQMKETMRDMENASESISVKLETINEKSENITSIIGVIEKVANQINMLSLNAAIEAEKAGEFGSGFSVVAREIRRLADRTAVAVVDIEQTVKDVRTAVSEGVQEMDNFNHQVSNNVDKVSKISENFTKIIKQVQALSPNFEGVKIGMQNQAENAHYISNYMVTLGEGMQQIKEALTETYHAIEQLREASVSLREQVSQFQVNA